MPEFAWSSTRRSTWWAGQERPWPPFRSAKTTVSHTQCSPPVGWSRESKMRARGRSAASPPRVEHALSETASGHRQTWDWWRIRRPFCDVTMHWTSSVPVNIQQSYRQPVPRSAQSYAKWILFNYYIIKTTSTTTITTTMHLLTLLHWPLTFQPQNHKTSRIYQLPRSFPVPSLSTFGLVIFELCSDKQTNRRRWTPNHANQLCRHG